MAAANLFFSQNSVNSGPYIYMNKRLRVVLKHGKKQLFERVSKDESSLVVAQKRQQKCY